MSGANDGTWGLFVCMTQPDQALRATPERALLVSTSQVGGIGKSKLRCLFIPLLYFMGRVAGRRPVGWGCYVAHRSTPTSHIARLVRDVPALPTRRRDEHRRCGGTACNDIGTVHTHTSPISPRVLCIVASEAPSFLSLPFFYGEGGAKRRVGWFLACRSSPHPSHRSLRSRCARPPHKRGRDGVRRSLPAYLSNFIAQNTPLRSRRAMRASFELCKAF